MGVYFIILCYYCLNGLTHNPGRASAQRISRTVRLSANCHCNCTQMFECAACVCPCVCEAAYAPVFCEADALWWCKYCFGRRSVVIINASHGGIFSRGGNNQ